MSEEQDKWQQEARMQIHNKNVVDRILAADERILNSEQKQYLGYEKDNVIAYYSKKSIMYKNTKGQIESLLKRSKNVRIILSASNEGQNMEFIKMATNTNHSYRIVSDEQFKEDTGLVVVQE
jgi:uncharacterized protein YueI